MDSDSDNEYKRRKRGCPSMWTRNVRKRAKVSGIPHVNSKNQFIPGKCIASACK